MARTGYAVIMDAQDAGQDQVTTAWDMRHYNTVAFMVVAEGVDGTDAVVTVEGSLDGSHWAQVSSDALWHDLGTADGEDGQISFVGDGYTSTPVDYNLLINLQHIAYRWVRVTYDSGSLTLGTITVQAQATE